MKSLVFLSPMHLLVMPLRAWESLVKTVPSEIIVLEWEGQETAWIEITITQLKMTSISLQKGQITQISDFKTSSRGM
jgi:hypothetical protein